MNGLFEGIHGLRLIKAVTGRLVETSWLMAPKKLASTANERVTRYRSLVIRSLKYPFVSKGENELGGGTCTYCTVNTCRF